MSSSSVSEPVFNRYTPTSSVLSIGFRLLHGWDSCSIVCRVVFGTDQVNSTVVLLHLGLWASIFFLNLSMDIIGFLIGKELSARTLSRA
jgi:hypothetical protein